MQKSITLTSIFPDSADEIIKRLQSVDTLQYIARPYAIFIPLDREVMWKEGGKFRFRLFIFGFIPIGVHVIHVDEFSSGGEYRIHTREYNPFMPVWNHTIVLKPLGEKTQYTDHVVMQARCFSGVAAMWAEFFYRHRQRKWRRLLKKAAQD